MTRYRRGAVLDADDGEGVGVEGVLAGVLGGAGLAFRTPVNATREALFCLPAEERDYFADHRTYGLLPRR
jgi:hypothetical protein